MGTVQLAIADTGYAAALREALTRSGPWLVECVRSADPRHASVLVVDDAAFDRLLLPLDHPERIVLIAGPDAERLSRAWEAGIVSVVHSTETPATATLAVMSAALRASKTSLS